VGEWASAVRTGVTPRAGLVRSILAVMEELRTRGFTGDPAKDWERLEAELLGTGDLDLLKCVRSLGYLLGFNRWRLIGAGLSEVWLRDGQYTSARQVLDSALAQDQVLGGFDDAARVQVMTIHRAKGKQFDGVVLVREGRHEGTKLVSSFVWRGDVEPYHRSRRILRVAITRAKVHAVVLDPFFPACPLIGTHRL
jgi:DNA helicase II / ATP-dependent DNA helicase PcrA